MQKQYRGRLWNLPPRGRMGYQICSTLDAIIDRGPLALYAAMALRGRAKSYEGRYRAAFVRFARANSHVLHEGSVGPKGGYGFELVEAREK